MRYQSNRPKRQFLAGVKCQSCGQLDTTVQIQVFDPVFDEYIECIHCQYSEHRPDPSEISQDSRQANGVGVVKFLSKPTQKM